MEKGRIEFDDPTFRVATKPFTHEGFFAYFDQMADRKGNIKTTSEWLADVAMLIADNVYTSKPLDMLIFCPVCGKQHIDRPDPEIEELATLRREFEQYSLGDRPQSPAAAMLRRLIELEADELHFWTNPIHKSHTCRKNDDGCGNIFRVADFPTNGVKAIQTKGKDDTWEVDAVLSVFK